MREELGEDGEDRFRFGELEEVDAGCCGVGL